MSVSDSMWVCCFGWRDSRVLCVCVCVCVFEGHALGLGHSNDDLTCTRRAEVMYSSISPGTSKRVLREGDIEGIRFHYAR